MGRDWQRDVLNDYLREHAGDPGLCSRAVYLADPERERSLDAILAEEYWPQVCEAVRASRWAVRVDVAGTAPLQAIRTVKGHPYTARELSFLLVDEERWPPRRTGAFCAWHCRGALRVTTEAQLMCSWRFSLSLPETRISVASLLPALQEPLLAGCPPELSYTAANSIDPCGHWHLSFSRGSGMSGWLFVHGSQEARDIVSDLTAKNLRAIDTVHELSGNFGDPALLADALAAITVAYEAW